MDDKKTILFHGGQSTPASQPVVNHGAPPAIAQPPAPAMQPAPAPAMQPAMGQWQQPQPQPQPGQWQQPQPQPQPGQWQQPQPQPQSQPQPQPQPQQWQQGGFSAHNFAGAPSKKKVYLAIAGAIALAVLGVVGTIVKDKVFGKKTDRGAISYASLGVDAKSANVDEVIGALESRARSSWRRDATWWALNMYGVRPDGTVDLGAGGGAAVVKFVSASKVQAASKQGRKDSIKEYKLTPGGVKSDKIISATKPWKDFKPLPTPGCKISNLVAALGKQGFTDGTVRISFDPQFGFASGWAWRVFADGKPYDGYFDMDSCAFSKKAPK